MEGKLGIRINFSTTGDSKWKEIYSVIDEVVDNFVDEMNGNEIIVEKYNYNITVKDNGDGVVKINVKGVFTKDLTFGEAIKKFTSYAEEHVSNELYNYVPVDDTTVKISVG